MKGNFISEKCMMIIKNIFTIWYVIFKGTLCFETNKPIAFVSVAQTHDVEETEGGCGEKSGPQRGDHYWGESCCSAGVGRHIDRKKT